MTRPIPGLHAPDTLRIPRARMVQEPLEDTLVPLRGWGADLLALAAIALLVAALWLLAWSFS